MTSLPYSPSDAYSVVALLLTLAGLLATVFAVQLSQWIMNMLGVRAKWSAYEGSGDPTAADARRECRAELAGLYNLVTLLATAIVGGFVTFVVITCFRALALVDGGGLKELLSTALFVFVGCYGILAMGMLLFGYWTGFRLSGKINPRQ